MESLPKASNNRPIEQGMNREEWNEILLDAAASLTQESCSLLGVKSIGVDYGVVRTGVAVTVGYDPKPLAILADLNTTQVCQQVVRTCQSERANQVVVGLPLHGRDHAEQAGLDPLPDGRRDLRPADYQ